MEIADKTWILQHYLNDNINRFENVKGIKKLLDEADAYFAIHKNQGNTFYHFVDYLTKMIESETKINLDKEDVPLNAVQLSTYHSSKGREFEYVFMPSLTSKKWESSSSSYTDKIPTATSLETFEECDEKRAQMKFLDNIKLLYVGMTRAKHSLYLSAIENGTPTGKPSWFIEQLKEKFQDRKDILIYPPKPEILNMVRPQSDYNYKEEFKEFIKNRFQKSYSPSSLNTYKRCPKEYFYNFILGLKSDLGDKDNATYGNAVHRTFKKVLDFAMANKTYFSAEKAFEIFSQCIDELPCTYPDNLKQSAKDNIFSAGKYYDKFISIAPADKLNTRAELALNYTLENGICFNGSIDRVDKKPDGTYTIYDYKTGTNSDGITRHGNHADYYYQIALYKYFFKKQYEIDTDVSTCFIYPLISEEHHLIKDISDAECEEIVQECIDIVGKINNYEFDRPNKCPNAKFCGYKNLCKINVI